MGPGVNQKIYWEKKMCDLCESCPSRVSLRQGKRQKNVSDGACDGGRGAGEAVLGPRGYWLTGRKKRRRITWGGEKIKQALSTF